MVGSKSRDYSNLDRLSECGYPGLFLSIRQSPNNDIIHIEETLLIRKKCGDYESSSFLLTVWSRVEISAINFILVAV